MNSFPAYFPHRLGMVPNPTAEDYRAAAEECLNRAAHDRPDSQENLELWARFMAIARMKEWAPERGAGNGR